jgi:hypothetical protein
MRHSLATASFAAIITALLAGCSNAPQASQSLPLSGATQSGHSVGVRDYVKEHGKLSTLQLMQLQAAGKMPSPLTQNEVGKQLQYVEHHQRPNFGNVRPGTGNTVVLWTSLTFYNDLLGQNSKIKKTVAGIDTGGKGCNEPYSVKVDHSQNIWVGCYESPPNNYNGEQEYTKSGSLSATYSGSCPTARSGYTCDYYYSYGYDGAVTSSDVFVALEYFYTYQCPKSGSCITQNGGGFEYWPVGGSSSTPTLLQVGTDCTPICDVYYMDVDANGNLWFDYYGDEGSVYGDGVGEITNPTTSPTFVPILNPGQGLDCSGGVYVSTKASVQTVNVVDCKTRKILRFNTSGTQTGTLGPVSVLGSPIGIGFNSTDTTIAVAESTFDWLDIGKLPSNSWNAVKGAYMAGSLEGVSYTPSDK